MSNKDRYLKAPSGKIDEQIRKQRLKSLERIEKGYEKLCDLNSNDPYADLERDIIQADIKSKLKDLNSF